VYVDDQQEQQNAERDELPFGGKQSEIHPERRASGGREQCNDLA